MPLSRKIECLWLGLRHLYPTTLFEIMIYKMFVNIFLVIFAQMMFVLIATIIFIQYDLKLRKTETYLEKAIQDAKLEILSGCDYCESGFNVY